MQASRSQFARTVFGLFLLIGAQAPSFSADQRPLLLEHLTTLEGLPQSTVYATLQDSQGFVWFGTEEGLVRYDGYEIHRYSNAPDINGGLPGNFVFAIAEDKHADIWLALKGAGIARWNRASDTFTVFRHDRSDAQSISSDIVRTLFIDSKDRIWIGTLDAGVDVLDPATGAIQHLRHQTSDPASLLDNEVYAMKEDRRGEVWIGTNVGLDRWTFDGAQFKHSGYLKTGQSLLAGKQILSIIEGNDGSFWVGTFDAGLWHLDYSGQTIETFRHESHSPNSLSSDEVHTVLDDHSGHLWIGTSAGLDILERGRNHISHYTHDKSDIESLSDSFIMSLYEDGAGLMWIGTRAGGVNRWNSHSWELGGSNPAWLNGKLVTSFADAADHHLWVGTLGGGLYKMDLESGSAVNLDALLHSNNALGTGRVMALAEDRHNTLWIGTWGAGLKKLTANGKLTAIPVLAGDARSLSGNGVASIFEAKNGLIWIGTHGGGANLLDPATGLIRQIPFLPTTSGATSSENVTSFTEDLAGNIWIGTEGGGLDVANPDGSVFQVFKHDPANPRSLSSNTIYALATDPAGNVWIATDGGGMEAVVGSSSHANAVSFKSFSRREGLSGDTIYSVLPDAAGHLWLSGNAGLMRFDLRSHAIKTFHREHGLQGEEFNSGAYYRTSDGHLCFGGPGGINIFDPTRLSTNSSPPRIALTGFEVMGSPVHEASPYWLLRSVPLDYRANVVSFDFAALDFKSPARNRLAYRLSGLTDQWIDLNAQRRVTLTNLDAGDHILEVRAANADSEWSTLPYRLTIHKNAAPWKTLSAYLVYAAALAGLALWLAHTQRRKLRDALAAKIQLEHEVALRTSELRETNNQLIAASEAKSDFLSRMGHELRTPMNGVVGMTELLSRASLPAVQARQVETIRTSAQTLLQILNDLLDLSKAQAGKIRLERLPIDLTQLMEECVAIFAGAASAKKLDLIICPAVNESYQVLGDPLRLRQILMNLIGNAIKFTERGEVVVTGDISLDPPRPTVRISVADTGIGISAAAAGTVFEPFTQADETTTRRFGGTGLGLSICRQLVELMGGDITVDSRPESGSTFIVSLPLTLENNLPLAHRAAAIKRTMIVATRRRSLAEAFRRHAATLDCNIRIEEPGATKTMATDEFLIIDAGSCPAGVEQYMNSAMQRVLVVATLETMVSQRLEETVAENRLLRSPVQRDNLRDSIDAICGSERVSAERSPGATFLVPRRGAHVLIVEDDEVNAAVAEGYIGALGGTSAWTKDGVSAVARSSIETFDLILMDLNMPGLDGYQTATLIRERERGNRRVPIVALTANEAPKYRDRCVAAGMDDILTKPYTIADCALVLRRWIDQQPDAAAQTAPAAGQGGGLAAVDVMWVSKGQAVGGFMAHNLFVKLIGLFENSCGAALAKIADALTVRDSEVIRANSHKLKGAAGNVGALAFAARLGELEHSAASNDLVRCRELYEGIAAAHPALIKTLHSLVLRESA